jgi:tripartite-type tricarboxylate transporter receptor subunit TctC
VNLGTIAVSVLTASLAAAAPALSQTYPTKPIRVIVPYPPADTGDVIVRTIAQRLGERMGQQIVVDNRAGASGQIGLELAARAAPDGYTLAVGQAGNVALAPHTYKNVPYDPVKDFVPVALVAMNYLALVVHPSLPYKSVGEMIAWAKKNPGQLKFASNGEGGFPHLSFELLRSQAGFSYVHVPYKGSAQIVTDLMGGQIDAAMASYTSLAPLAKSGKVRLLGITNPSRMAAAPEVPTVADAVPGYSSRGWFGFLAPAKTPRSIVVRLNEQINQVMKLPEMAERMTTAGLVIVTEPPEAFGELIRSEHSKDAKLTREIGFKPQ